MYCPRCGSQNTDSTKFCRQCGLGLAHVMDYVATGGTGPLTQPQYTPQYTPPPPPLMETAEMQALKHKKTLTVLGICIAPIILSIFLSNIPWIDELVPIPWLLVPIGVVWARLRYKTELHQLQERQIQEYYARQQYQQPQQAPAPKLVIQAPSNKTPVSQIHSDTPKTNPLAEQSHGSVAEDETRKFPEHH